MIRASHSKQPFTRRILLCKECRKVHSPSLARPNQHTPAHSPGNSLDSATSLPRPSFNVPYEWASTLSISRYSHAVALHRKVQRMIESSRPLQSDHLGVYDRLGPLAHSTEARLYYILLLTHNVGVHRALQVLCAPPVRRIAHDPCGDGRLCSSTTRGTGRSGVAMRRPGCARAARSSDVGTQVPPMCQI